MTSPRNSDRPADDPEPTDGQTGAAPTTEEVEAESPRPRGVRLWLFRLLAAVVVPLLLLCLLELGLRIAGYGLPTGFFVKSDVDGRTVYAVNRHFPKRFFPESIVRAPSSFVVPAEKPDDTFRIFVVGGSAALGYPDPTFSFGRVLEAQLRHLYPGVNFALYNASVTASNSHVIRDVAADCAELDPDLVVIYLGNNEVVGPYGAGTVFTPVLKSLAAIRAGLWVKSTRTGQLLQRAIAAFAKPSSPARWEGMAMFLEQQVAADDPGLLTVYEHFGDNLDAICSNLESKDIPTVLCTVATNLRDSAPFASLHRSGLSKDAAEQWQALYDQGVAFEDSGDWDQARGEYRLAAEIDDRFADLHYRIALCAWNAKDYVAAGQHFIQARELDALRFRADIRINEVIRKTAQDHAGGVKLADFEKQAAAGSPHGIPGRELFLEHVHLDFRGNWLLGTLVLNRVQELLPEWIKKQREADAKPLDERQCAQSLAYTNWQRYKITKELLYSMVRKPPFTNQLYHAQTVDRMAAKGEALKELLDPAGLVEVDRQFEEAIARHGSDCWLRLNYAAFLLTATGDARTAEQHLRVALRSLPLSPGILFQLGEALARQGRFDDAQPYFAKALALAPYAVELRAGYAGILAQQGKTDEAIGELESALEDNPQSAVAHHRLGEILESQGRLDEAIAQYREALEAEPDFGPAQGSLATALALQGDADNAIAHFRKAVEILPDSPELQHNLGAALESQGKLEEAAGRFRRAVQLRPSYGRAHLGLGRTLHVMGREEEAAAHLQQAGALGALPPALRVTLGDLQLSLGNVDEAIAEYRAAVQADPNSAELRYKLGEALNSAARRDEAETQLTEAIRLRPDTPAALNSLAWLLATSSSSDADRAARAVGLAERACALTQNKEPRCLDTLAAAYAATGRFDDAIRTAKEAIALATATQAEALADRIKERLGLYQSGQAVQDASTEMQDANTDP